MDVQALYIYFFLFTLNVDINMFAFDTFTYKKTANTPPHSSLIMLPSSSCFYHRRETKAYCVSCSRAQPKLCHCVICNGVTNHSTGKFEWLLGI